MLASVLSSYVELSQHTLIVGWAPCGDPLSVQAAPSDPSAHQYLFWFAKSDWVSIDTSSAPGSLPRSVGEPSGPAELHAEMDYCEQHETSAMARYLLDQEHGPILPENWPSVAARATE
jgi:hypothetical protein